MSLSLREFRPCCDEVSRHARYFMPRIARFRNAQSSIINSPFLNKEIPNRLVRDFFVQVNSVGE